MIPLKREFMYASSGMLGGLAVQTVAFVADEYFQLAQKLTGHRPHDFIMATLTGGLVGACVGLYRSVQARGITGPN